MLEKNTDRQFEENYQRYKARHTLKQRRSAIALSFVMWCLFFTWDFFYHEVYSFNSLIVVRTLGALLLLILALISALTQLLHSEKNAQVLLILGSSAIWLLVTWITLITKPPYNYLDYTPGFLLIYFYLFCFLWIKPKAATIVAVVLQFLYQLSQLILYLDLPSGHLSEMSTREHMLYYWISATLHMLGFIMLGYAVAHLLEQSLRHAFSREQDLATANNNLITERAINEEKTALALRLKDEQRHLAELANQEKSRFLAAAAHDLRQPMQALSSVLEALSHCINKNQYTEANELIDLSQLSAKAMCSTFNAILDISELQTGFVKLEYSNFDVVELIEELITLMRPNADAKRIELKFRKPKLSRVHVWSDHTHLKRILINLVSNAIKFTDHKDDRRSGVLVNLLWKENFVRVDIIDTGIGISKEHWDNIFSPFFQVNNDQRNRARGLGLGLSIVSTIVQRLERHHLEFNSILNKGTRFSVEIPRIAAPSHLDHELVDVALPTNPVALVGAYIWIIEDDCLVRSSLAALMDRWSGFTEEFSSFEEFCKFLPEAERFPDIVLTDHRLANSKTAIDVANFLRGNIERRVPIIVITGEISNLTLNPTDFEKFSAVLRKPVAPSQLLKTIELYLKDT